jgi:hypothetical protein
MYHLEVFSRSSGTQGRHRHKQHEKRTSRVLKATFGDLEPFESKEQSDIIMMEAVRGSKNL